ncbi:MAG: hypothetical protein RJA86_1676, partial [Pseudomonadota bacterium]
SAEFLSSFHWSSQSQNLKGGILPQPTEKTSLFTTKIYQSVNEMRLLAQFFAQKLHNGLC